MATLTPSHSTFWINARSGQVIDVSEVLDGWANHNEYLVRFPEVFGLDQHPLIEQAKQWSHRDLIGSQELRTLACQQGWARVICRIDFGRRLEVETLAARHLKVALQAMMVNYPELNPLESVTYDLHSPPSYGRLKGDALLDFLRSGRIKRRVTEGQLTEMPIARWDISPNFDANAEKMRQNWRGYAQDREHWHDLDKKAIRNPQTVQRITSAFAKCPHEFRLFFYQIPDPNYDPYLQHGALDPDWDADWPEKRLGSEDAQLVANMTSPDAITIVLTNNLSDDFPIRFNSPWIVAHRVAHCLEGRGRRVSMYFRRYVRKVLTLGYGLEYHTDTQWGHLINQDYDEIYGKMMGNLLGTMKSARQEKLVQASEWAHETLAQYLLTGKITLRPLPEHFDDDMDLTHDPAMRARVLRLHAAFPKFLMGYFDRMLDSAKGQVFVG